MELQEIVTALEAEKKQYIAMIESLNCEKIALDQMLVDCLKQSLNAKKELLMKEVKIQEYMRRNDELEKIVNDLTKEKEDLQLNMSMLQSDAQSGG